MKTITITDPGYDIEVWGWAGVYMLPSVSPSMWELSVLVDGVIQSSLAVPYVDIFGGGLVGLSIGTPLKRSTHSTGSNTTITVAMYNVNGGGTVNLTYPSTKAFDDYNYCEFQYRKNG
jgi:hypothetical protein